MKYLTYMGLWTVLLFFAVACGDQTDGTNEKETEPPSEDSGDAGDTGATDTETETEQVVWDPPKNVVLFIGDGMGENHVAAGSIVKNGELNTLVFESFPVQGQVNTETADSVIPDSAATATAIATGVKVNREIISMEIPGDGHDLPSLVDFYKQLQKSTGLVTTCYVTDATPAAFAAHTDDRYNTIDIAWHYLNTGRPDILFGGGGSGPFPEDAEASGYTVIDSLDGFDDLIAAGVTMISGQFGEDNFPYEANGIGDLPHLYEMTLAAVSSMSQNEDGFFVMVEGGRIDDASEANDVQRMAYEVIALDKAVEEAVAALNLSETLVIVTADHSTGGLEITANNGKGELPDVTWESHGHSAGPVPLYAIGKGADAFSRMFDKNGGFIDNTDIYRILTTLPKAEASRRLN